VGHIQAQEKEEKKKNIGAKFWIEGFEGIVNQIKLLIPDGKTRWKNILQILPKLLTAGGARHRILSGSVVFRAPIPVTQPDREYLFIHPE
jgi:hypothetical protein